MRKLRFLILSGLVTGMVILTNPICSGATLFNFFRPNFLVWESTHGPLGGLGYDIRYNFQWTNEWYVTDSYSGFHRSEDGGETWITSNTGITTRGGPTSTTVPVFSATVDPHHPSIIWIGTQDSGDIYQSTNRGQSWMIKTNGIKGDIPRKALSWRGFTVDPRSSNTVYAMGEIGSKGWTPDGAERKGVENDMTMGVVYKTVNGGAQWAEIWRGNCLARYCWINPTNTDILYVSTGIFDREAANADVTNHYAGGVGILKSLNGGTTWQVLNETNGLLDLSVSSLFMHPQNPEILLTGASSPWSRRAQPYTHGVYLTTNGGAHWDRVLSRPEDFSSVEISAKDPRIAYAGSRNAFYRSEDGSYQVWQRFGRTDNTWGPPGVIAGWPIDIQCDPTDTHRILVNNYGGGNFLSRDGGETWEVASQGYSGAQTRQLAVLRSHTLFVGGRTGIFITEDAGQRWRGLAYPDATIAQSAAALNEVIALAVNPRQPDRLIASFMDIAGILYSDNGGLLWRRAAGITNLPQHLAFTGMPDTWAYAVVSMIPKNAFMNPSSWAQQQGPENGLFQSLDSGASWARVSSTAVSNTLITTLAVHPRDARVVYVTCLTNQESVLLKTTDGGSHWTRYGSNLPPKKMVRCLAINPAEPDQIFAGFYEGPLYRSTNGGGSFQHSSTGLPAEASITSLVVYPFGSGAPGNGWIFAADERSGVFLSNDGGTSWKEWNTGLVNRGINALGMSPDGLMLYAATEGNGVYRMRIW